MFPMTQYSSICSDNGLCERMYDSLGLGFRRVGHCVTWKRLFVETGIFSQIEVWFLPQFCSEP